MNSKSENQAEELEEITKKLNDERSKFIAFSEPVLESIKEAINAQFRDYYSETLNYIRNISIVSGTVAPFSLLLFQATTLPLIKEPMQCSTTLNIKIKQLVI